MAEAKAQQPIATRPETRATGRKQLLKQAGAGCLGVVGLLCWAVAFSGLSKAIHHDDPAGYVVAAVFGAVGLAIIGLLLRAGAKDMHRADTQASALLAPGPDALVRLDSGRSLFINAAFWFVMAPVGYVKLDGGGAGVTAVGLCALLSILSTGLGVARRRWWKISGGVRPAPVVPVPPQPSARLSDPRRDLMKEPLLNVAYGVIFLSLAVGFSVFSANAGAAAIGLVGICVAWGVLSVWILSIGVRRLIWFRHYKAAAGEPPW